MKTKLLLLVFLAPFIFFSQTQIGDDIDGESSYDYLGQTALSFDGSIVVVGARDNGDNPYAAGHARVFQNLSGIWTQIGQDIDGEARNDNSGSSVSISSDGSIVAIGAPKNSSYLGHVRVYQNLLGVWTQIGQDIDGEAVSDRSGDSVSLSSDGSIVAIGAIGNDENGINSGHVRVYQYMAGVWTQIGADIDGEAEWDEFGLSVCLSSDGNTVAIGAPHNQFDGYHYGYVRVYQNLSGVWSQIGTDIEGEQTNDQSGNSVSLSSDGSTVAIGARWNNGSFYQSGHVRVYQNLSGVWTQIGVDIDGEAERDGSGHSVSLSSDGNILAIGATGNDGNGDYSGHVRVYQNMSGVWKQIGADIDGEEAKDASGHCVSLSSDGNTLAITAELNDGGGDVSGHVRVYDVSGLLSLVDNKISKNFTLYPNPVTNQLHIQLANSLDYNQATIYNYFGQLVLQSETTTIDVSNLAAGVYFLEVDTNEGKGVKKFIKQ